MNQLKIDGQLQYLLYLRDHLKQITFIWNKIKQSREWKLEQILSKEETTKSIDTDLSHIFDLINHNNIPFTELNNIRLLIIKSKEKLINIKHNLKIDIKIDDDEP